MKRSERLIALTEILASSPSKVFPLKYFCDLFDCAKSSISEDIQTANQSLSFIGNGRLETIAGREGGVRFVPAISKTELEELQKRFCEKLSDYTRVVGANFLYTSDIFCDSSFVNPIARAFAYAFKDKGADYIATVETKGIPLASQVAHYLHLPLIIIRREARISEGSTVSINYLSGSSDRLQKMSMSKRALAPESRVVIIDDFMRGGGTSIGIEEMVREFDSTVVGKGIAIVSVKPERKSVQNYKSLVYLGDIYPSEKRIEVFPNEHFLDEC